MYKEFSARTLWMLVAGITVAAMAAFIVLSLLYHDRSTSVQGLALLGFSQSSTATVSFAGQFPALEEPRLAGPKGMHGLTDRLYVALADIGTIGVFTLDGQRLETITVAPAEGVPVAYLIDVVALSHDRLLVIDASGGRVIFVDPGNPDKIETLQADGSFMIGQPTAIEYFEGEIFIADGADETIKVFDERGTGLRVLAGELEPPLTFVGDLHVDDAGTLWASDSNIGRVVRLDLNEGTLITTLQMPLSLPRGIDSDEQGRLMVSEAFAGTVRIFDTDGVLTDTVGDALTENIGRGGQMTRPEALWWDAPNSRLYVTDSEQGRIKVYNLREEAR